ncbi:MAG: hypothetical protein Q9M28_05800 [Mariprofundaceae bacterium]|nr:hypothetical protein [Mariprofundaceae bacterium]
MKKKVLYIDMDNVLVDFESSFVHLSSQTLSEYEGRLDEVPNIFSMMQAMPDAIASFHSLSALFDTYLLSTAPWQNASAWSDKLNWVKQHLGEAANRRLILSHHKNLNVGHFLIDDRLKNGTDRFQGEHLHFGTDQFPDWASVLCYLRRNV